jgi:hypothetical protein
MHEGWRIAAEISLLNKELERPITPKRRMEIQQTIDKLEEAKKQLWTAPRS